MVNYLKNDVLKNIMVSVIGIIDNAWKGELKKSICALVFTNDSMVELTVMDEESVKNAIKADPNNPRKDPFTYVPIAGVESTALANDTRRLMQDLSSQALARTQDIEKDQESALNIDSFANTEIKYDSVKDVLLVQGHAGKHAQLILDTDNGKVKYHLMHDAGRSLKLSSEIFLKYRDILMSAFGDKLTTKHFK